MTIEIRPDRPPSGGQAHDGAAGAGRAPLRQAVRAAPYTGPRQVTRDLFDLTGRVAIVTGAASGLGEAIACGLATFGADVVAVDLNGPGLWPVEEYIESTGRRALAVPCDVSRADLVGAMVEQTLAAFGRIDILVNS
ncbi:MAG: SDR family NAD(P)-dependent oxidoreductase, partial [Chloroflexi bacterium]|nr:SDR family NAD(P)-dependent oxidoreductase [Chloroflexota bacterium]